MLPLPLLSMLQCLLLYRKVAPKAVSSWVGAMPQRPLLMPQLQLFLLLLLLLLQLLLLLMPLMLCAQLPQGCTPVGWDALATGTNTLLLLPVLCYSAASAIVTPWLLLVLLPSLGLLMLVLLPLPLLPLMLH
jgi:hypothetical protein